MAQSFFPISIVNITPSFTELPAWVSIDVSAHIPAGSTGVLLHCTNPNGYGNYIGLRKNGSSDSFTNMMHGHYWAVVGVDASRIFEAYCYRVLPIGTSIYLVGYTTSGVTFHTNAYTKNPSVEAWEHWTALLSVLMQWQLYLRLLR